MKSEFIMSLYEQLMGADKIEPQEKSIIDRSVGNIYREYLKNYQGEPPTLKNLYDDLMKQVNPEAHWIALALELFTVGSLNVFSHQTNINTKSRILCFDIQDLGENLKSVGLLVMLDAIYNRVIQTARRGNIPMSTSTRFICFSPMGAAADAVLPITAANSSTSAGSASVNTARHSPALHRMWRNVCCPIRRG